jgi:hypothetical protein
MQFSTGHVLIALALVPAAAVCGVLLIARQRTSRGLGRTSPTHDPTGKGTLTAICGVLVAGLAAIPLLGIGKGSPPGTNSGPPAATSPSTARADSESASGRGEAVDLRISAAYEVENLRRQVGSLEHAILRLEAELAQALASRNAYANRLDDYQQRVNKLTAELDLSKRTAERPSRHDQIGKALPREGRRDSHARADRIASGDDLSRDVAGPLVPVPRLSAGSRSVR